MVLKKRQHSPKKINGLLKPRSQVKAPPTKVFTDLKKETNKTQCRIKINKNSDDNL